MMKPMLTVLLAALALSACASRSSNLPANAAVAASSAVSRTSDGLTGAAMAPLGDLNLVRNEIPPLLAALESPYQLSADLDCDAIAGRIGELDALLGRDWDTPAPDKRLRTEELADAASEAALDAVESGVTGWMPFRGLIRKASGAEAYARRYTRAFTIGAQQRAYLKGMGLAKGCPAPARPDFLALESVAAAVNPPPAE